MKLTHGVAMSDAAAVTFSNTLQILKYYLTSSMFAYQLQGLISTNKAQQNCPQEIMSSVKVLEAHQHGTRGRLECLDNVGMGQVHAEHGLNGPGHSIGRTVHATVKGVCTPPAILRLGCVCERLDYLHTAADHVNGRRTCLILNR